jgi:hypothetical protein
MELIWLVKALLYRVERTFIRRWEDTTWAGEDKDGGNLQQPLNGILYPVLAVEEVKALKSTVYFYSVY